MPDCCIVAGCDNINDIPNGIVVHKFPFLNDDRPEAKKRRKQWTRFVRVKRGKDKNGKEWVPTSNSGICSVHFRPEDFQRNFRYCQAWILSFQGLLGTTSARQLFPRYTQLVSAAAKNHLRSHRQSELKGRYV